MHFDVTLSRMTTGKLNVSIRLDAELKAEVERVAALGGVSPSDVIRVCVSKGLPIMAEGYTLIHNRFASLRRGAASSGPTGDVTGAEAGVLAAAAEAFEESGPTPPTAGSSAAASGRKPGASRGASRRRSSPARAPK